MAKTTNDFLLVQVTSGCFQSTYGLHLCIVFERIFFAQLNFGRWSGIQIVQFEWLSALRTNLWVVERMAMMVSLDVVRRCIRLHTQR